MSSGISSSESIDTEDSLSPRIKVYGYALLKILFGNKCNNNCNKKKEIRICTKLRETSQVNQPFLKTSGG